MLGREMHGNRSHVPIPSSSIKEGDNCTGPLLLSPSNFISIGWQWLMARRRVRVKSSTRISPGVTAAFCPWGFLWFLYLWQVLLLLGHFNAEALYTLHWCNPNRSSSICLEGDIHGHLMFRFASIQLRPISDYDMLTVGRSARDLLCKKIAP